MSQSQHEKFNLNRQISLENSIDPAGKKWEIHGKKGSSLVHARPNPDRADAVIPDLFAGEWTSPTTLKARIDTWLNRQWNESDKKVLKAEGKKRAKSAKDSLKDLPDEIKKELGDVLAVADDDGMQVAEK